MEQQILFFYEKIQFKLQEESKIATWLISCAKEEKQEIALVNCIFCDDDYLLEINKQYLKHDYYTDIITFDYTEENDQISGDVFISVDRAMENSKTFTQDLNIEINRLLIHGLLHLMGYKDKQPEDKRLMTSKEDHYLALI